MGCKDKKGSAERQNKQERGARRQSVNLRVYDALGVQIHVLQAVIIGRPRYECIVSKGISETLFTAWCSGRNQLDRGRLSCKRDIYLLIQVPTFFGLGAMFSGAKKYKRIKLPAKEMF